MRAELFMSINDRAENWPALNYFEIDQWDDIEIYRLSEIPDGHMTEVYYECGSHPDVVSRVWQQLAKSIPDDCCSVLNGHVCLLHDRTDILLAVCMGTEYTIRVPKTELENATESGLKQTFDWGGIGRFTDLREEFGPDWFFGAFKDQEAEWVQRAYETYLAD